MKIYQHIAAELFRIKNCEGLNTENARINMADAFHKLRELNHELPSGSGFDSGSEIDVAESDENELIITTSFHHMDECGGYDGWTEHSITVRPSLLFGIVVDVDGENRNDIHEYICDTFREALEREMEFQASPTISASPSITSLSTP